MRDISKRHRISEAPYKVGYGKPPMATRFGVRPQPIRDRKARAPNPTKGRPDLAALLDQPIEFRRNGKRAKVHPHEAALHGLFKRAAMGELRPIKEFLHQCQQAGLLDPEPCAAAEVVLRAPAGVPLDLMALLLREVGNPPWDPEIYAAYKAEYEHELAHIERLKQAATARIRTDGDKAR